MGTYVVIDLEMCRVPKKCRTEEYHWANETIQIGAVVLNENMEITDKFVTYVKPEYGYIDEYICKLTGITDHNVKDAPNMEEALQNFVNWIPDGATIVAWSNNDEFQIQREIRGKKLEISGIEKISSEWIDCQQIFGNRMSAEKCYRLSEALLIANIWYEDGEHDGLVDAHNTALLFAKLQTESELQLNPYYKGSSEEEKETLSTSLGTLLASIDLCQYAS